MGILFENLWTLNHHEVLFQLNKSGPCPGTSVLLEGEVQVLRCYLVNINTEFGLTLSAINETDFLKCIEFIVRKIQPLCPIDIQILIRDLSE